MEEYFPDRLPLAVELRTPEILEQAILASRSLAELKGLARGSIPNQAVLISFFSLREAKTSSEIENIRTTVDELVGLEGGNDVKVNEVLRYSKIIQKYFRHLRDKTHLILTQADLKQMSSELLGHESDYVSGRKIVNSDTQETLLIPVQDPKLIEEYMDNLLQYFNDDGSNPDPLIRMGIIHYQFEVIHPFVDGNGRLGRIINILYLFAKGLLDFPSLYLSSYINKNRSEYYKLLQSTRITGNFEPWLIYMLKGIEKTAKDTIAMVKEIKKSMDEVKILSRNKGAKNHTKDFRELLFSGVYTTPSEVEKRLKVTTPTAISYLEEYCDLGVLQSIKRKGVVSKYYNVKLIPLLKKGFKNNNR